MKLHYYKNITHKECYDYFLDQIKGNYPETDINQKHFIVYRWDSIMYDCIYRDQMKVLDSMASTYGKYKLEYIFVTEMEEKASMGFLKRSFDEYKNVKMLYGMDDFISGIYSLKDVNIVKPKYVGLRSQKEMNGNDETNLNKFKQTSFYLIMDSKGTVLHMNGNKYMILKDTVFLSKLSALIPEKNYKILN